MLIALHYAATLVLSLGLALYLTPFVRQGALSFGVLDHPDGHLKQQQAPVPYLGGIAVYLAFLLTLSMVFELSHRLLGLLLGGTMLAMLGLFDDLRVITPRLKFAGQLLAAWVMIKSGITIDIAILPFTVTLPLTVFWLVGITNAINLVDVADGLATGVAAISALGLFIVAAINGDTVIAVTTLALAGSLVGFLRYNEPPARIYLGDAGSLFIGFMLAALAMVGQYTSRNDLALAAPVLMLAVPIMETVLLVIARLGHGVSPFHGSHDHMALRLRARGFSPLKVLLFAYSLAFIGVVGGIAIVLVTWQAAAWLLSFEAALFLGVLLWLLYACPAPVPPAAHTSA